MHSYFKNIKDCLKRQSFFLVIISISNLIISLPKLRDRNDKNAVTLGLRKSVRKTSNPKQKKIRSNPRFRFSESVVSA
jgi:hypothetical protein